MADIFSQLEVSGNWDEPVDELTGGSDEVGHDINLYD